MSDLVSIFSTAIIFLGLAAAFAGKWLEEVGPRLVGFTAACLWGGGFLVGSIGIFFHELSLVYLGYGVLGGCGLGLGYVSPVSTLIRWFPDRRGMATGMAIMGFGGGAMIGAPLISYLLDLFHVAPVYLGSTSDLILKTIDGVRFADINGALTEVVVVTASEAQNSDYSAGAYIVGTGDTGAGKTFVTLGICLLYTSDAADE